MCGVAGISMEISRNKILLEDFKIYIGPVSEEVNNFWSDRITGSGLNKSPTYTVYKIKAILSITSEVGGKSHFPCYGHAYALVKRRKFLK